MSNATSSRSPDGSNRLGRMLLAKPGLDTHERGAKLLASALSAAGIEVIYLGVFQTDQDIVEAVREHQPDLLGLSYLDGGHHPLTAQILESLKTHGLTIPVVCGGVIPQADVEALLALGVRRVYGPGTPMETIAQELGAIIDAEGR